MHTSVASLCHNTKIVKSKETVDRKNKNINTQSEAVLHFLQRLDTEMIDLILESDRTYQSFEKHIFIRKLGYAIDEFIESGDTCLNLYPGHCNAESCNYRCKGYTFVGNNSGNYFDLLIEVKDGIVQDICECFDFKCIDQCFLKNKRIWIDPL